MKNKLKLTILFIEIMSIIIFVYNIEVEDYLLKEKDENLINGMILLSCSILGKHAIENNNKRITKTIKELSNLNDYEFNEAYNIVNLMMIKNCYESMDKKTALELISNKIKPSRDLHSFLNIIKIISIYEKYDDKNILFDQLEKINNQLADLDKNLSKLKDKRKNEKTIEEKQHNELKRKIEKKEELINKYKEGVQFNHPEDPTKQIKITPNNKEFVKYVKRINEELELTDEEEKCYNENFKNKQKSDNNDIKLEDKKIESESDEDKKSSNIKDEKDIHKKIIEEKLKIESKNKKQNKIPDKNKYFDNIYQDIIESIIELIKSINSFIFYLPEVFIPLIIVIILYCLNKFKSFLKSKKGKN